MKVHPKRDKRKEATNSILSNYAGKFKRNDLIVKKSPWTKFLETSTIPRKRYSLT